MKFKNDKPTWKQARAGDYYREVIKFCWWPTTLSTGDVVWLDKVKVTQKASFTSFANNTKWITVKTEEI